MISVAVLFVPTKRILLFFAATPSINFRALKFIEGVAAKNNKILFVGTKRTATDIIKNEAIRCSMPYVNERWLGGMLTNYKTIRSSITRPCDR